MQAFIIEDDYLISQSLADMLSEMGFSRFAFARSEDAAILGASSGDKFDLITADTQLLPGDGVNAVEAICKERNVPVVFVTGYADELKARLAGRHEQAAIVSKPINKEELGAAVRSVLRK